MGELRDLIQEKTRENPNVEICCFPYDVEDVIDVMADKSKDPFWNTCLKNFVKKLGSYEEDPYAKFLRERDDGFSESNIVYLARKNRLDLFLLMANSENQGFFNDFCKEITGECDVGKVYLQSIFRKTKYEG